MQSSKSSKEAAPPDFARRSEDDESPLYSRIGINDENVLSFVVLPRGVFINLMLASALILAKQLSSHVLQCVVYNLPSKKDVSGRLGWISTHWPNGKLIDLP